MGGVKGCHYKFSMVETSLQTTHLPVLKFKQTTLHELTLCIFKNKFSINIIWMFSRQQLEFAFDSEVLFKGKRTADKNFREEKGRQSYQRL